MRTAVADLEVYGHLRGPARSGRRSPRLGVVAAVVFLAMFGAVGVGQAQESDVCAETPDAPWCAGPSDPCAVENRSAAGYCADEEFPAVTRSAEAAAVEDGGDDAGEQARERGVDDAAAPPSPTDVEPDTAVETLPETGAGLVALAVAGAGLVAGGGWMLRRR